MKRRRLWMLLIAATNVGALPAQAQMWFDTAAIMQPVVLNPCPAGRCPTVADNGKSDNTSVSEEPPAKGARSATTSGSLSYYPSVQRRRANLAELVARTRADNPESGTKMEQLFASTDVIEEIGSALKPYGYSVAHVGDAYAFWWMTAWEGARGSNRAFNRSEMKAVQLQAHQAIAKTQRIPHSSDAQKQQVAEALWIQATMIDGLIDMAKEQPELMPQLQQAIRRGALASGVDLDAVQLTPRGFINR
jgi:hypothetical protein